MMMTDLQRRWWFANHPEFSWTRTRSRLFGRRPGVGDLSEASKTALANERLREALSHPAADPHAYDKYEDVLDRIWDYGKQQKQGFRENWNLFLWRARQEGLTEEQARTLWNQMESAKAVSAPLHNPWVELGLGLSGAVGTLAAVRNALARRAASAAEAAGESRLGSLWDRLASSSNRQASSLGESGGPGKWVEVRRGSHGLEHQSKMSGQPIRPSVASTHVAAGRKLQASRWRLAPIPDVLKSRRKINPTDIFKGAAALPCINFGKLRIYVFEIHLAPPTEADD